MLRVRPELAELSSYVPADPPGIEVRLDANEAPANDDPAIREAVARAAARVSLERYPDPRARRLREQIARRTGAREDGLVIGAGSDEIIALLFTALAVPRERSPQPVAMWPVPTFGMYRHTARAHGWKPLEVPLDAEWDLDAQAMERAVAFMPPSLALFATPNNPTGNRFARDRIEAVALAVPDALVVVDEAYVAYTRDGSWRSMLAEHPNVAMLGTLSKIGLAALRVGWIEADPVFAAEIDKVRQPFNTSALAQAAAAEVLESDAAWGAIERSVALVTSERARVAAELARMEDVTVTASDANFLWVSTRDGAQAVYDGLVARGVLVRSFHSGGGRLGKQLRITIGNARENDRLLDALGPLVARSH